jgi:hypothetical protein
MILRIGTCKRELADKTVEAEAGAGAVRVTVNGKLEVVSIRLDPTMICSFIGDAADSADRELVEELIVCATNEAMQRAQELVREQMSQVTGGLIPGGLNLPGLEDMMGKA